MIGPGKYDVACTMVRQGLLCDGLVLVVLGGPLGHGFSCQVAPGVSAELPGILRGVAGRRE